MANAFRFFDDEIAIESAVFNVAASFHHDITARTRGTPQSSSIVVVHCFFMLFLGRSNFDLYKSMVAVDSHEVSISRADHVRSGAPIAAVVETQTDLCISPVRLLRLH